MADRWNRKALSFQRNSQGELCLKEFILFFDEESAYVNDPVFSREGISKYARKLEKEGLKKKGQNNGGTQH